MREYQQYIGGQWAGSDQLFDDLDPYRGTVMARIPAGTRADAARAIDAAAAAFPAGPRCRRPRSRRLFLRAADIVERREDEIKELLATETGLRRRVRPLPGADRHPVAAPGGQLGLPAGRRGHPGPTCPGRLLWRCASRSAWWRASRPGTGPTCWPGARWCSRWRSATPWSSSRRKRRRSRPGCWSRRSWPRPGSPTGTINVITHAPGEAVPIADEFFERPAVRCINFTGSSATGRILAERAGRALKRMRARTRRLQPADRAGRRGPGLRGRRHRLRRLLPPGPDLHEHPQGPGRAVHLRHVRRPAGRPGQGPADRRPGRAGHDHRAVDHDRPRGTG